MFSSPYSFSTAALITLISALQHLARGSAHSELFVLTLSNPCSDSIQKAMVNNLQNRARLNQAGRVSNDLHDVNLTSRRSIHSRPADSATRSP